MIAAASTRTSSFRAPLLRRGLDWCARMLRAEEPALWTIAYGGRIVGVLSRAGESYRIDWFVGADDRLTTYDGPISADTAGLAAALAARLGEPSRRVRIVAVPI